MKRTIILLFLVVSFWGCENPYTEKQKKLQNINFDSTTLLPDTSIILTDLPNSNYQGEKLTDSLAKSVLYEYFLKQGVFNEKTPFQNEQERIEASFITYDTMFLCNLNNNLHDDAVVSYWIMPWMASGHCWQPQKAVIVDTDKGYQIFHEDFIPTNIAIDSIKSNYNHIILYAYDYDCTSHLVIKNMKIRIK